MALLRRITLIASSVAALTAGLVVPTTPALASGVLHGCSTGGTVTSGSSKIPCPTPLSPADSTTIPQKDLVLTWTKVDGASHYQVQISPNGDWTNNKVDLDNGGRTVSPWLEVPMTLPHTTYYWRVRADVGGTWGGYSKVTRFLREWEAPITILHMPSSTDPTVSWAPVREASEYQVLFEAVDGSVAQTQAQLHRDLVKNLGCFTAGTTFTPNYTVVSSPPQPKCRPQSVEEGTQYVWGVAAEDDSSASPLTAQTRYAGCGGDLDPPECDGAMFIGSAFTPSAASGTGTTVAGVATWHTKSATQIACDGDNPGVCPTTPSFTWNSVTGATNYDLRVYLDRDATNVYSEYVTQYPQFTPTNAFPDAQPGQPYFWDVEADICGGAGVDCTPPSSAAQACAPGDGAAPSVSAVAVSPAGTSDAQSMKGGTSSTVKLTGTGIQNGACVTASGGVVRTAPTVTTGSDGTSTVSFSYYAPVSGGSVTFQIENPNGAVSATSPAITVTSSTTGITVSSIRPFQKRSGPVTLESPKNQAVEHGRAFTFRWNSFLGTGAKGSYDSKNYELQVSRDDNFATTVLDVDDIDLTRYTDQSGALTDGHYFWRVAAIDQSGNVLTWSDPPPLKPHEFTVNATRPTVHFSSHDGIGVGKSLRITFSDLIKGVNARTLMVVPKGKPTSHHLDGTITLGASPRQFVFTPKKPLATGGSYVLHVSKSLKDANHNSVVVHGGALRTALIAKNGSEGWSYSTGWVRHAASSAFSGSYREAAAGRSATLRVAGNEIQVSGCKGPGMGSISFLVAGKTHTVQEQQSFTRCGVILWHRALPDGIHTLHVRVRSGHGNFDAVTVT